MGSGSLVANGTPKSRRKYGETPFRLSVEIHRRWAAAARVIAIGGFLRSLRRSGRSRYPSVELRPVLQDQPNVVELELPILRHVLDHFLLVDILHALTAYPSVPQLCVDILEVVDVELDPIPTLAELVFVPLVRLTLLYLVISGLNAIPNPARSLVVGVYQILRYIDPTLNHIHVLVHGVVCMPHDILVVGIVG